LFDNNGVIIGVAGLAIDITERTQMENLIHDFSLRLDVAMTAANMAWWEMDIISGNVTFDKRKTDMLGYSYENFKHYKDFMDLVHPDDYDNAMNAMKGHFSGLFEKYETEYRILEKSGKYKWFYDIGSIVKKDSNNVPLKVAGIVIDISNRKLDEEKIKNLLSEKEILLKEVHHRIKNNIASVEVLLSMQANSTAIVEVKNALMTAVSRVQGIRVLYEKLLIGKDYKDVSIKNYIESLIDSIVIVFPESQNIIIEKKITDFNLNSKKVIPLGIIINELMTNIFKYAFKGTENNRIIIELDKTENHITLTVHDNGIGLPENVSFENSAGFGLQLVEMLTKQIGGIIKIERGNGTTFTLILTKRPKKI